MKTKTIKSVLSRKFAALAESITNEQLRERVKKGTIITGGAIASMLLREPVNDYDLYFRDKSLAEDVARYYVEKFKANPPTKFKDQDRKVEIEVRVLEDRVKIFIKSAGAASEEGSDNYEYFEGRQDEAAEAYSEDVTAILNKEEPKEDKDYRPIFLTANAITLSGKMQLIVRFYGEPEEIHANYDFLHCTSYWQSWDGKLVLPPGALEALLTKELRYVGSKYPVCSLIRTRKFIGRGWTINAGQFLKMAYQVSKLDLNNMATLEDQLIGVDSAYFSQLIHRLQQQDPDKVDGAYLMAIIDKIF